MAFAVAVVRFCRTLPHTVEGDVLRRQLLKAGTSVGANFRASCRGRSPRERKAKMGIALEEADECDYWLTLLEVCALGDERQRQPLLQEAREITGLFTTSVRNMKSS